jgi:hypothetical protein
VRKAKDNQGRHAVDLPRETSRLFRVVSKSLYKTYRATVQEKHEKRGDRIKGAKSSKRAFLKNQIKMDRREAKKLWGNKSYAV